MWKGRLAKAWAEEEARLRAVQARRAAEALVGKAMREASEYVIYNLFYLKLLK